VGPLRCELAEHADVVFEEKADVVNLIVKKNGSVYTHAECIPAPYFRVYAAVFYDIWVHHAASHDFQPA